MNLTGKVIEFTKDGLSHEDYETLGFDFGMYARVISHIHINKLIDEICVDMTEFLNHNELFMQPNWPGNLKWIDTKFYSSNNVNTFRFIRKTPPFIVKK